MLSNAGAASTVETFKQMVEVLRSHLNRQGKGGGQCKLSVEDQLLLCWNQAIPHPKNDTVVVY